MHSDEDSRASVGRTFPDLVSEFLGWLFRFMRKRPLFGVALLMGLVAAAIVVLVMWQVPAARKRLSGVLRNAFSPAVQSSPEIGRNDDRKEKVILLLPTGQNTPISIKQDAERQVLGFFDYLSFHDSDDELALEIVVRSHDWEESRAEQIIREEMRRGNRYFVVTMSKIAEPLAQKWRQLKEENCPGKDCLLISTVASAQGVVDGEGGAYRFYIRSNEEARELASFARYDRKKMNAATICVKDNYGKTAASEFKRIWESLGGKVVHSVLVPPDLDEKSLNNTFDGLSPQKSQIDAVFIANYGNGIGVTIKELHERNMHPLLLLTSTFSIKEWRSSVGGILNDFDWISLRPSYKTKYGNEDVVRDFTFYSLVRLEYAILFAKKDKLPFSAAWQQVTFPDALSFVTDDTGDSVIYLRSFDHKDAELQEVQE